MKNQKNIEFGALKIFSAVADSETLTQAAEQLGITQSAVSQAIKKLEAETCTELVVRRSRPTKLTPGGDIFKDYARHVLAETHRMQTDIEMASKSKVLQLNIGMIDSFGDVSSLEFVRRIKPYAEKLSLRTGVAAPLSKALVDRDLDMLITSDPLEEYTDFARFPIFRDPFVMIVPETYSKEGNVTPQWLAQNVPFVHYSRETRIGMLTDLIAHRLNIKLNTHYELDSTQTLLRFVRSGQGWGITTGLCLLRYPELLEGTWVLPLANGANARYLSLLCRDGELGELPENVVKICKDIYTSNFIPKLTNIAPWLSKQSHIISELPII